MCAVFAMMLPGAIAVADSVSEWLQNAKVAFLLI